MSIKLDILFSNFFDFKSTNNIDLKNRDIRMGNKK